MVTLLNMFITFGDILLPNSGDYDDLYYEMIRCRGDLLKFYEAGMINYRFITFLILLS